MRKRLTKKILSMLTAFLLVVSMLSVSVYADTEAISDIPAAQEQEIDAADEAAAPAADEAAVPAGDEAAAPEETAAEDEAAADETASGEAVAEAEAEPAAEVAAVESDDETLEEEEAAVLDEKADIEEPSKEEIASEETAEEKTDEESASIEETEEDEKALTAKEETKEVKKAAASDATPIAIEKCTQIGYDEDYDWPYYYINIGDVGTLVEFTDFADKMSNGSITPILSAGTPVDGTNIIDLQEAGYSITYDQLQDAYEEHLDADACEGLDFSNIYGAFIFDDEYEGYFFIIQGVAKEAVSTGFTLDKGEVISFEKGGHTFYDWLPPTWEYTSATVDLYTVKVPLGTTAVNLSFEDELLAYAYGPERAYIDSCADYGDGSIGQKTATVKALEDGTLPIYVYVQTPYDASFNSTTLYAIQFVPSYTFTASYGGEALTDITFEPGVYQYLDYMAQTTVTVGAYTITIPDEAESIDFVLSDPVLHYNYTKDGQYLGGWVENFMEGDTVFSQVVDYGDSMTEADGQIDYIQIQSPYDAMYNSELFYVITFLYESGNPDPDQTPEDIPQDVVDIYKNVGDAQDAFMADEAHDIYTAEWIAMELSRAGYTVPDAYYEDILNTVKNQEGKLDTSQYDYTNYARVILALTAGGKDPRDVAGYDLTEALADYDAITKQGVNGAMYALLALDSGDFEIPTAAEGKTQATRDNLVEAILAAQHDDGGWAYMENEASDPDLTAIAIQALAPYYHSGSGDIRVKKAVDKALDLLSSMQTEEGTFKSDDAQGAPTSESTAQVIVALTALGINPATDERFVKGEKSAIDGLCSFWTDGGFKHTATGSKNAIATYQGYYALVSYNRLLEGKTSLYDMTDVELSILTIPEYTITFETNGGSSVEAQTVTKKETVVKPDDPTKAGYGFAGWYADDAFSSVFDFDTPVTKDLTVYAKWDKVEYTVTGGGDSSWTQGSADPLVVTVKRSIADETCFSHFKSVEIDGSALVKDTDYTAVSGSTVVTLKPETLQKLTVGSHSIKITFDDGLAQTAVNIQQAAKAPEEPKKVNPPKTGDNASTLPWLFLIGLSGAALIAGFRLKRRNWL